MLHYGLGNMTRSLAAVLSLTIGVPAVLLMAGCGSSSSGSTSATDTAGAAVGKFIGVAEGVVSASRSTRESLDATGAQQTLPANIDAALVSVTFEDLSGQSLLGATGQPFPPAGVDATGAFRVSELPVGIEFVIVVDLTGDGVADIRHVIQIPADAAGEGGLLRNVVVDPLTTLVLSKLLAILQQSGINPQDLEVSPTAIVERIIDSFIHLFEESGIDQSVTIDDIQTLTDANVDALFDSLLPAVVRSGIDTVGGALALDRAVEVDGALRGAAEVFLRAGFPIGDEPGGLDLSFLGTLPNVQVGSFELLFAGEGPIMDPPLDQTPTIDPSSVVIYLSTVTEPDRNFLVNDQFDPDEGRHHLPVLKERLLTRMAQLHLANRVITLRNLYGVLTDETVGLGVRLTYMLPNHGMDGPPPMIFETADGTGVAIDIDAILFELFQSGLFDQSTDFDTLEAERQLIRDKMRELLAGTSPPSMQRLFGAILSDRIESIEQLFSFIRKTKVHLPFSRSGPSSFFVIADGDPFRTAAGVVNPISVDVDFGSDGVPLRVIYNATHAGAYYLGFTFDTEFNNTVQLLVRETGFWLHGRNGEPKFLNMGDSTIFEPINGIPLADFVSEEGAFWPGVVVVVSNPDHTFGETTTDGFDNSTIQLFVLAAAPGPDADPVRVDYDVTTATFTASPFGRYYLMFVQETESLGKFGLYDIDLNFMAGVSDLTGAGFVDSTGAGTVDPVLKAINSTLDDPAAAQTTPTTTSAEPTQTFEIALVHPSAVVGLVSQKESFRFVFGTEVPNERFDPAGNPYFDDVNGNGTEDFGEITTDFRPILFNRDDWRSTDISRYYRRASGGAVTMDAIDFESPEPRTFDGELLVPRNLVPRLNAFKFGRPNTAITLLTTFLPPEFFDGAHSLTADTPLGIFQALAMINLIMEQMFNVEAIVDFDGDGPFPPELAITDAHLFVLPIGDPLILLLEGFEILSQPR